MSWAAAAPPPPIWTRWIDREALLDAAPLLVAIAPFGAVIGVQSASDDRTTGSLAGTLLLYAGSAQATVPALVNRAGIAAATAA